MPNVFLSSTSLDLPEYRQAAVEVCNALGLVPLDMKDWSPRDAGATRASLEKLDRAHVYVGIFAYRYGYIEAGIDCSVTEAEYDHAETRGLERLCFLVNADHPWPPSRMEHEQRGRLETFKTRVRGKVVNWFTTVEDFRYKLHKALGEWQQRAGQPMTAPLPTETGTIPRQLPRPPADFVGRGDLLDDVERQIDGGITVVGVHGPGGVGKTSVVRKLAERVGERYPGGQIYLDLKGVESPLAARDVMAHVIHAFHAEERVPQEDAELAGRYRTVLAGKRVLLVLDNAASEKQVEPLLPDGNHLVLVTSRRHFHLPGMAACDLDTLPPTNGVALLRKIAPRLGEPDAGSLARACGYLPLALRLAGSALARRKDLSVQRYLKQLETERLRMLAEVAASIRLSEEQLPPAVRSKWAELAVLVGGFETAWAAAVWGMDEEAADTALGDLVTNSLLDWDEKTQSYRLHDLIREYADRSLNGPTRLAAQRRHARHFCGLLASANEHYLKGGPAVAEALGRFDRAWPDAQAGFAWAMKHLSGDKEAAGLCCEYANGSPNVRNLRQHPRASVAWLENAVKVARELNHRKYEADALRYLGWAYGDLGQVERAIGQYEQALVVVREIGDRHGEGNALGNLGLAYTALGQTERAIGLYEQRLVIARESSNRRDEGNALGSLGSVYAALGQAERAIGLYEQALVIVREIGDRRGEGYALGNLGGAYAALGQTERAIVLYEQGLVIVRELGDRRGEGNTLGNLGSAYAALGQGERAIGLYEQQLVIVREIGDRRGEAIACWNLGLALVKLSRVAEAISLMEVCVRFEQEIGHADADKHAAYLDDLRQRFTEQSPQ